MTCRPVIVSVTETDESGHVTMREWFTCVHTATWLTSLIGAPHRESILDADAATALDLRRAQHPGVVITDHQEG